MRKGLTLLELLVVVVILVTVTAAAIPMMVPAVETRRQREAARGVSTFLAKARADAISRGRPVGVFFSPSVGSAGDEASETLHAVEVPPPFAGMSLASTVVLERQPPQPGDPVPPQFIRVIATFGEGTTEGTFVPSPLPSGFVRPYDLMRVNEQGASYQFVDDGSEFISGNDIDLIVYLGNGSVVDFPLSDGTEFDPPRDPIPSQPLPYKVTGRPVASASQSFTLPTGAVVDLYYSGIGPDTFPLRPVGLMFSASGAIDGIYFPDGTWLRPTLPVHFLIGKSENVPVDENGGNDNWKDLQNFWVSVGNQTGQVVTSEMASGATVNESRLFARDARGMGGK